MFKKQFEDELRMLAKQSLDEAMVRFGSVRKDIKLAAALRNASIQTPIPGYPILDEEFFKVDEFIALMVDMRDSTKHLLELRSGDNICKFERLFYETSTLLPVLARCVAEKNGNVTEYLGDGLLALFHAPLTSNHQVENEIIYSSYRAAKYCIEAVRTIINPILKDIVDIPPLSIGIGIAYSSAIVSVVGLKDGLRVPKVIGECVYRASKLSKEVNEIMVDDVLYGLWPKEKDGQLRFKEKQCGRIKGYMVSSKPSLTKALPTNKIASRR